jgi:hypothetical protein
VGPASDEGDGYWAEHAIVEFVARRLRFDTDIVLGASG